MSTTNIYILRLEGGRYYVGKTDNLEKRKQQHINGTASAWTKKYKVVSVDKIIPNSSHFDEDKYTKEYMSKYGIDKVRGGSYTQINLDTAQREAIEREIIGAKDGCQQCGEKGHFIRYCPNKNKVISEPTAIYEWECDYCDRSFTTEFGCTIHEKSCKQKNTKLRYTKQATSKKEGVCYRCGRPGHFSPDCYARTHHMGYTLDSDCESDEDSD
jgi:predicted GIY-YIG superfamily endonuclease